MGERFITDDGRVYSNGDRLHRRCATLRGLTLLTAALIPLRIAAQQEFVINSNSPYTDLVRGAAWGTGVNNFWTLNTLATDEGMCVSLVSNNPTSPHSFTLTVYSTLDQRVASFNGGPPAKWQTVPTFATGGSQISGSGITPVTQTVPANGKAGLYFRTGGAARVSIQFSASTSGAGSPDTADIFAVHNINGSTCGLNIIGPQVGLTSINGAPINSNDGNFPNEPQGANSAAADAVANTQARAQVAVMGSLNPQTNFNFISRFNGATWDRDFICNAQLPFNLSSSGNTQIIPAGTGVLRICHISFSTTAAEDWKLTQGTGANCGTGTADLTGLYKAVQSTALDFTSNSALRSGANQAVCLNQSAAQALGGVVVYAPAY